MTLRPYQHECIQTCLEQLISFRVRRQLVSLPVGSGKTVVFSNLIPRIPPPNATATKTLVLAHREELINQAYHQLSRHCPTDYRIRIDQAQRRADLTDCDVVVASIQSLSLSRASTANRLLKYDPSEFKCIVIDEAHHAASESYLRLLHGHFETHMPDNHIFLWGCSATALRNDAKSLAGVFDQIPYQRSIKQMIDDGWLCNVKVTSIKTSVKLDDVELDPRNTDYKSAALARCLDIPARNRLIVETWQKLASNIAFSTLVFAVDKAHVRNLHETFQKQGYHAEAITSDTPRSIRAHIIDDFRQRKFPILINCGILTEGTDIPAIDCILMARPTRSSVLYQQMLGRGVRLYPGKSNCHVIDFVDNCTKNAPITTPSLLGIKLDEPESNNTQKKLSVPLVSLQADETASRENDVQAQATISKRQWDLFKGDFKLPSKWNWISVGQYRHVLNLPDGTSVKIDIEDGQTFIFSHGRMFNVENRYFYKWKQLPISAGSMEVAIRAAEAYISKKLLNGNHFAHTHLNRSSGWRSQMASEKQISFARKLGLDKWSETPLQKMTKGELEHAITMVRNGYKNSIK